MELSYNTAVELLERAIDEKGADYEYTPPEGSDQCLYFHHGQPSCIVGHVMSYLGFGAASSEGVGASTVLHEMGVILMDGATNALLNLAQEYQDQGTTWGCANGSRRSFSSNR